MGLLAFLGQIRPDRVVMALEVIVAIITILLDVLVALREATRRYQE